MGGPNKLILNSGITDCLFVLNKPGSYFRIGLSAMMKRHFILEFTLRVIKIDETSNPEPFGKSHSTRHKYEPGFGLHCRPSQPK